MPPLSIVEDDLQRLTEEISGLKRGKSRGRTKPHKWIMLLAGS